MRAGIEGFLTSPALDMEAERPHGTWQDAQFTSLQRHKRLSGEPRICRHHAARERRGCDR